MKTLPIRIFSHAVWACLVVLSLLVPNTRGASGQAQPLNFVFILADDLGWTDLSVQGSKFYETPNIDRLAREGMRFTDAYSACTVCSPTRASILTGKYPARLHITDWIKGHPRPRAKLSVPDWTMYLPLEEVTIPEALKSAGYTSASIGKWHLGGPEYYPDKQGFDLNLGGCDRGQPPSYFSPYKIPTLPDGPVGEFLTDRESAEAVKWITAHRDQPFFLYMPHHAVHTPLMGKTNVVAKYRSKADASAPQRNATYAALIESMDDSVGRVMRTLEELKLADRTVVIFTSDNGGLIGNARNAITTNLGLRAGKGSAYEGGVRVPLIIKWPGVTKPGSLSSVPVISADYFPTLLQMAGVKIPGGVTVDGESLVPVLQQKGNLTRDAIYWHYPHYHPGGATPYGAIRAGEWRLVEFYEDNHVELYRLRDDPMEKNDLASTMPDKARELRQRLDSWRKTVGAQMPTPNPRFDSKSDTWGDAPAKAKEQ